MDSVWKELHSNYQKQSWVKKPSIFAEQAIRHFPGSGKILELGAGHGQDSFYFAQMGYPVVATDIEISNLSLNVERQDAQLRDKIEVVGFNLKNLFPFNDQSFDVVYAHLSLHYFDQKTTQQIFSEIKRILRPEGVFAFLANSLNDPEYGTGTLLEDDFFLIDKVTKRYFSVEAASEFAQDFQISLLDNQGETYKDREKGVSKLIRFIGRKSII